MILIPGYIFSQEFRIDGTKKSFSLTYKQVNGLIIIPVSVNGSEPVNFILDTGSQYTIVTDKEFSKGFLHDKTGAVKIRGAGPDSGHIDADISKNNVIRIEIAEAKDKSIVILDDEELALSQRFGVPINGIIGYELFKDFVIKIDPIAKKITFFEQDYFYKNEKLRRYREFPLEFEGNKPYININRESSDKILRLLVDSGNSDALWIYENEELKVSDKNIEDYLGFGISGDIEGVKSRIGNFKLGDFEFKQPIISFPDSSVLKHLDTNKKNGSIGAEILNRFTCVFDYKQAKLYLKKNKNFRKDFNYNLAGIELFQPNIYLSEVMVAYVRKNSPAYKAGIKRGDEIIYINEKKIANFENRFSQSKAFGSYKISEKPNIYSAPGITILKSDPIKQNLEKNRDFISLQQVHRMFRTEYGKTIKITYRPANEKVLKMVYITLKKEF